MAPIITTGIEGPVISRQELRTFLKDKELTNLYILAMDRMMRIPQEDVKSWFQIGAIHGRPFIPYDNVGQKGSFGGYCCHSSTLFPPWHRPFLALLEQFLGEHAKKIACEFVNESDKERYIKAAERFRLPYWDWALEAPLPDIVASQAKVECEMPNGQKQVIDNPLYGYKFEPAFKYYGDTFKDLDIWEKWNRTLRYPTNQEATADSAPASMEAVLKNNQFTLRDRCYNLLTRVTTWTRFSHDADAQIDVGTDGVDSIESIHNQMHVLGGKDGHMGVVEYAAFDPVFWLHHGNVDRIFALWQALNPDEYVNAVPSQLATFTRPKGDKEDANTPLAPFRKTNDTFWTSAEVRDTRTFNYTYPELADLYKLSSKDCAAKVRFAVNKLYGKTAPVSATRPSVFDKLPSHSEVGGHVTPGKWHKAAEDHSHYHEWFANIEVQKYSLKKSFMIHVFLGDVPVDSSKWAVSANLVGTHCVFASHIDSTSCEKCQTANAANLIVHGNIPLTHALGNHFGKVTSLESKDVLPVLKEKLKWVVETNDGKVVPNADVPGLKVTTGSSVVQGPTHAEHFPTWNKAVHHHH
ncbi:hypothetical protein M422DRAFT_66385 [Sphaerobolus stellatus SS14]|uniref:tyrosinase n=1 Tax=Sphaerobolus stellatus (strain SS14) TaxID=990650 RepID=A0A0C9W5Z2_SPHS4|nr:hypothetical protein M422DRAFT_66385 [Sphaerobolus stellatus SS14]